MWGLASISSYDAFHFHLVIIDEHLHYIWFYPLARKSDVIQNFPTFLTLMEN